MHQGRDMRPFYEANVPLGRIGEPDDIADAMLWLASDQRAGAFMTMALWPQSPA
ncbi:SDR family oxidoreductase [Marinivivus vitaminiproducens]|uniref:SDR family oxidoreductase n=1 Tax=Marinivivus vitaminiproducens TaxID=3035935 RepID=UPI00279B732D|nr:SDR family oxidoreductase [Geminicoccaceae bacterium SCSIO 64248]